MKSRHLLSVASFTVCILLCADLARAAVSYWDPDGFRGSYNTYSGAIPLTGSWDTNGWARNTAGAVGQPADQGLLTSQLVGWTDGDAAVFCVGAGATNNVNNGGANTTTFTVWMTNNHTIAGIFDGSLNNKSCKVTIDGPGILTLSNGFDAFNITTNTTDGSLGVVTVNVALAGPGILTAENSGGQIFLNGANTWTGGTQLGFSNQPAFLGTINFNNSNSFGSGPIVVVTGNSGGSATLQCTNPGVTITNAVDFTQALSAAPFLTTVPSTSGTTFSGPWTLTNAVNLGVGPAAANVLTISGPVTGTASLTKFNAGTLVLLANNSYSGATTISAGTLQLGSGGTSGSAGAGNITDNGTLAFKRSDTVAFGSTISGTGNLTQSGAGTLTLNAANTYAGTTAVSAGTLQLGLVNAIPSASPVQVGSGAVLDLNGLAPTFTSLSGAGNLINGSGTFIVNGNSTTAGINTTYSCLSGAIGGSGTLDKQGSHAMALRGPNSFSGGLIEVESGILSVGAAANRLPIAATLLMLGGTFQLDANNQTVGTLTGSGAVNLGGGTLTVNQAGSSTFGGVIRNSDLGATSTASGNGLRGYYYDNEDFTSLKAVRNDTNINFANLTVTNAVTGLPPAFGTGTNQVSVRWLGQVLTPNASGSYSFTTACDDGSRLWVNGTLVVDNWIDQGAIAKSGTINLSANTLYDIVMEYYNNAGGANAVLSWTPPGGSLAVIPSTNLFLPGAGALVKLGAGTLTLSGVNTYTGSTIVGGGTLEISSANGLASPTVMVTNSGSILKLDSATALSSTVSLILNTNGGATPTVNLNFAGSMQLGQLSLDGGTTFQTGTWGSGTSGAQHTSSRFTGNGQVSLGVCSSTNRILSISNSAPRIVTITMQGTAGSQYYVITHTNVLQPIANWTPVTGSTNTPSGNGIWSLSISNPAPTAAYRVKAASPCP